MSKPTRCILTLILLAILVTEARATWSILIVDLATGEIAIGAATCLQNFDLRALLPVVVIGVGAACAQSSIDIGAANRIVIRDQLLLGATPAQILSLLSTLDPAHFTRQYGIINTTGGQATFSGSAAGAFAGGLVGQMGTLRWVIQGNVLTGMPVITAAETAIQTTMGDLPAKLMAAMQAARAMGGDGRCSCSPAAPTSCGAPPPSFTLSANIGFMIVARLGDADGGCAPIPGCASGNYYLNHNVAYQNALSPDPVLSLQTQFNTWRTSWIGRPDHHRSAVSFNPPTLPDNGVTQTTATITLRDWQGTALSGAGTSVTIVADASSTAPVTIGPVIAQAGGIFTCAVTAGSTAGLARLRVTANDGLGSVLLGPLPQLSIVGDPLWVSRSTLNAAQGGIFNFILDAGPMFAGRPYALAASNSGSTPGVSLGTNLILPLNPDNLFTLSLQALNTPLLPGTLGTLSMNGVATAGFLPGAGFLTPIIGTNLSFAFATLTPFDFVSNAVSVAIQ